MEEFSGYVIVEVALVIVGIVGFLFVFVLKGIKDNQTKIWDWARDETKTIADKIDRRSAVVDETLKDMKRWVRHEHRAMYSELIELARIVGREGKTVEDSILNRLSTLSDDP